MSIPFIYGDRRIVNAPILAKIHFAKWFSFIVSLDLIFIYISGWQLKQKKKKDERAKEAKRTKETEIVLKRPLNFACFDAVRLIDKLKT